MMLAFALPPAIAGEKTVTISRNEGIYKDSEGVYYCYKDGITMTFSSGMNNVNYLVEHQQVVFYIRSDNYVIKKIKFNCLDNTTNSNMDCFYWGPSTIHELGAVGSYTPTGNYASSGYIGTWVGGSTDSKDVKFTTEGKPVRFGSVEITYDKEFGDIYDLVTSTNEIAAGNTYALVSKQSSRALGKVENHDGDYYESFSSTPVTLLDRYQEGNIDVYRKVKVTDEVQLIKLERAVSTTTTRPWHLKVGDNYIRRRNGENLSGSGTNRGYNLYAVSTLPTDEFSLYSYRVSISFGTNHNALLKFYHPSGDAMNSSDMAIRHYNGGSLFRVMDSGTSNADAVYQRVYLYKPAQSYEVTTECIPANGGYITLGNGILTDNQGKNWSQQYDNVTFFVGPTDGWGVGNVTVTDMNTRAVTTLQPTNTGDFGNDYSFEMPANDVKITANFLEPVEIDTICNPANGGQFNFINGYTNFNGQYYSNDGKTVTFKPTAADGFIFNSVTITDNGVTTTMTPDADGVYSFVMPDHPVTLTANFEEATDLYLLGTANGVTGWYPYGPKFIFDTANEEYYIDVYFKGGNDNPNIDQAYGYFSLTKKIDLGGNWGNINGYRLAAEYNNYWVEDGDTGINLYGDRNDNAFKIKPGVYRIKVDKTMTHMSIVEYPLSLSFDPVDGSIVESGQVVTITSNLDDLVHDINPDEVFSSFYNTTDNWATQENDNTAVITQEGITTVKANTNLGYIHVEGQADYEIIGDLYLLGTANGLDSWQPYGPQFTYDANTETYSLDVYFTGLNVTASEEGYGYFSLSTVISDPEHPNWADIPNSARYNAEYNGEPITGLNYNESVTEELYQTNPDFSFKIDPGVYTITVNKDKTQMTVTKHELTLTFNPASGTTVAAGDPVNISSNLDQLVHAINPNEDNATFMYATSTDGSLPTPDTPGSTVNITAVGATTTVNAQATLGYINVPGNANYNIPAPTVYSITTLVTPADAGAGVITAPTGSVAGETVTFTVTDSDPSVYTLSEIEVYNSYGALVDVVNNGDGTYSFTMPSDDVTIHASYTLTQYTVTTSWSPIDGGAIWLNGVNTPQTVVKTNGEQVEFGVTAATEAGYRLTNLVVTNLTTNEVIATTPSGSNGYTFTMPTANVSISAEFDNHYNITTVCVPEEGGTINISMTQAMAGQKVFFTLTKNSGYVAPYVTISYVDENNETQTIRMEDPEGQYNFDMPAADVTITAYFAPLYLLQTQIVPSEGGQVETIIAVPRTSVWLVEGANVYLTMRAYQGYRLNHAVLSYVDENDEPQEIALTPTSYTTSYNFRFTMPPANAMFTAYLDKSYRITKQCTPPEGGTINLNTASSYADTPISFTVTSNVGYAVTDVTISYVDENDVTQTVVLTPDENGVYDFTMPEAPVTINANFAHIPYGISAVCIPNEGGSIEVASSAYTGDQVAFTVNRNPGYDLISVTVTNTVTGQEIVFTQGQNGQNRFVMPDAAVVITANFTPISDLYLLGTANGETEWAPTGPKFDYDIVNDEYTLTVYFKGIRDVAGQNDDRYGYFNLTTVAHESDWDYIAPYRLVPRFQVDDINIIYGESTKLLYRASDGYNADNKFGIPAGVYTLTVPGDKSSIKINRIPVSVTLTPSDVVVLDGYNYVDYGTVVTASSNLEQTVHAINPDEDNAVFFMHVTDAWRNVIFDSIPGNQVTITTEGENRIKGTAYIGWIMPDGVEEYCYHPLRYIETATDVTVGEPQVLADTLVGVWAAGKILWAKDLGNRSINKDYNTWNLVDYGIDVAHMQDPERGWDQSNWVMLDFTDYLNDLGYTTNDEALGILNKYVNKQLKSMSVRGFYERDATYRITLYSEPEVLKDTVGYPGYLQDPLELLAKPTGRTEPVIYHYNHYTPCNFMYGSVIEQGEQSDLMPPFDDWDELEAFVRSHIEFAELWDYDWSDSDNWTDDQWDTLDSLIDRYSLDNAFFVVRGKPCEVAHVWAVWRGDDVFDVYERSINETGDTIYNRYDLEGAFRVGGWEYNRLTPNPAYYGEPEGLQALHVNAAYEFHIAIMTPGENDQPSKKMRKAPVAKGCEPNDSEYLIYPLDLKSHSDNVTDIPEISMITDDKMVISVRYYNLMGQESRTPFDGINIEVIRYNDGSMISRKILK